MNFKDLIKGANFILEKKLIFDENIIRKKYDGKKISEKFEEIYFSWYFFVNIVKANKSIGLK